MKRIWSNGMALLLTLAMLLPMLGMAQPVMADTGKGRVTDAADVGTATAVPNDHGGVSVGVTWEDDGIVCATEEKELTLVANDLDEDPSEKPYLYVSNILEGVPEGIDISNDIFESTLWVYNETSQKFEYAADREYWVVDSVHLDGTAPMKLETGHTSLYGRFTLKAGQIIAFQADCVGQKFRVEVPYSNVWVSKDRFEYWYMDVQVNSPGAETSFTNMWYGYNFLDVDLRFAEELPTNDVSQAFDIWPSKSNYWPDVFEPIDGGYVSNNKGKPGSRARLELTSKGPMDNVSFTYSYSSEDECDKFTLRVGGKTIEDAVSGPTTVKTWSGSLDGWNSIDLYYEKNDSGDSYDDQCKIYNISFHGWVPVDTEDDTEFTFELKDSDGNAVTNALLEFPACDARFGSPDSNGRFSMKVGEPVRIGLLPGDYTIAEVPMAGYDQVFPFNGEAAQVTVPELKTDHPDMQKIDFFNVTVGSASEDGGYVFPKTGGTGVMPIYGIGATLALCGCAVLAAIRKRKDGDA